MEFKQLSQGYRYNSDSLMLYDFISRLGYDGNLLDVGCGCGILGALLKRDKPKISLCSIDIQPINVEITKHNMENSKLEANVIEGDFLNMEWESNFDVIVSNPPYYHDGSVKSNNEHLAKSRYNRYLPMGDFLLHVKKALTPKGKFYFCYDAKQIGALLGELLKNSLTPETLQFIHPRANKDASLVLVSARKNSKSLCCILAPRVVNSDDGYTQEAKEIFAKANTMSRQWE